MAYLQFTGGNQQEGLAGLEGAQAASGVNDHIPNQVMRLRLHTLVAAEMRKLKEGQAVCYGHFTSCAVRRPTDLP